MRRSRPRSECASTTTKYSCFIDSPERTPFWIRGTNPLSPGARWGYYYFASIGELQTVTALPRICQPLQVIDNIDNLGFGFVSTTARNAFFAESGGAAQPAVPTGAPRFRAALCRQRDRLDLGPHSSACAPD